MSAKKEDWNFIKGKLKQKYAQFSEDDIMFEEGIEDVIEKSKKSKSKSNDKQKNIF